MTTFVNLLTRAAISLLGSVAIVPLAGAAHATVYDPAADFEQGFTTQSNPNGVWSYGYSSGFTTPVTLYDQTVQNGINGPNAQYWLSPSNNIANSPSAEYNNGLAYDDGNVNFLANQFVLVSGIGGEYSDLVFTTPSTGTYSIAAIFRGDQYGIGTVVDVVENGNDVIFNSSVTAEGQTVPFDTSLSLTTGETVEFSVGPDGGLQNTGLSLTITSPSSAIPEPSTWAMVLLGFVGLGFAGCRRARSRAVTTLAAA